MTIEGFDYGSFPAELVSEVLTMYVEKGMGYERISCQLQAVPFASAQRIVAAAVTSGVISEEDKHPTGRPKVSRERIEELLAKFPGTRISGIAQLADCSETVVYRYKASRA